MILKFIFQKYCSFKSLHRNVSVASSRESFKIFSIPQTSYIHSLYFTVEVLAFPSNTSIYFDILFARSVNFFLEPTIFFFNLVSYCLFFLVVFSSDFLYNITNNILYRFFYSLLGPDSPLLVFLNDLKKLNHLRHVENTVMLGSAASMDGSCRISRHFNHKVVQRIH